jgi:hypothetical protein
MLGARMGALVLAAAFCARSPAEIIALDNGAIRVEFDSQLFAVCYVGAPGGKNLLAPLHVPDRLRQHGAAHFDPGGLAFSLQRDTALTRIDGPAEVITQSPTELVLLSPTMGDPALRLHLELRLDGMIAGASLRLDVQTEATEAIDAAIVSHVILAPHVALHVPKSDATIRAALPEAATASLFVDAGDYWDIDSPGTAVTSEPAVADFECGTMSFVGDMRWTRSIGTPASGEAPEPWHAQFRRDPENRQRSLQLACPSVKVDLWNQPALLEHWQLIPQGE